MWTSIAVAHGLSSCGSWALEHRLSNCGALGLVFLKHVVSPESGIRPVSTVLAGGFFTIEPLGKPPNYSCNELSAALRKCESVSRSVVSNSFQPHGLLPTKLLCLWNSPGKNTGVSCCSLLHGVFLTQGSNPGLLHCRQILYHLSYEGSFKRLSVISQVLASLGAVNSFILWEPALLPLFDFFRFQPYIII